MKNTPATRFLLLVISALVLSAHAVAQQPTPDPLAAGFGSPPASARPHTWWHWMNGNVSEEGITLDLEAMKRVGIGGFQLFQVGTGIPKGPAPYGTPQNVELVKFAAREADRLGLEFTMHNCPGWSSSGGPWITPELSMQVLVMTETNVTGGQKVNATLQQPTARLDYYRDAFVLAFPTPDDGGARITNWNVKANFPGGRGGDGARGAAQPATAAPAAVAGGPAINPASVIDLSRSMDARGQLAWDAPPGNWTILRIGHTTTGAQNRPPPDGGAGLECDKFSRAAMDFHFYHFFGDLLESIHPLAAKGLAGALIDSYETGLQNWTADFPQEFKKRCGYDLRKYLPAMFGRVVGSLDMSERFLWDIRKTQADLMAKNYYGRFAELCHQHGMKSYNEPYDPGNFDEMAVGRYADMPMGEFWQNQANHHSVKLAASVAHINGRAVVGAESFTSQSRWTEYPYSLKALGDFMYTQGLNRYIFHRFAMQPHPAAVPGMTMGPWGGHFDRTNTWFEHGEEAWLQYVARCQYLLQRGRFVADLLYFAGEDSPARTPQRSALKPAVPQGWDFDTINADAILSRVNIDHGRIVLPDGMSYRVLVLPEKKTMTLDLMRRIRHLVRQGMCLVVAGPAPENTPGLVGYPATNAELRRLAADVWGSPNGTTATERKLGRGRVFSGQPLLDVLARLNIKPDFESTSRSGNAEINYIHRRIGGSEIYFVANRGQQSEDLVCTFDVNGKRPELWDPVTGQIVPASAYDFVDGRTRLPLQLGPAGSVFVVFRSAAPARHFQAVMKEGATLAGIEPFPTRPLAPAEPPPSTGGGRPLQFAMPMPAAQDPPAIELAGGPRGELLAWQNGTYSLRDNQGRMSPVPVSGIGDPVEIVGPWRVSFPPNLGAPPEVNFDKLISWTESSDDDVKYFSGTATYTKRFNLSSDATAYGKRVYLDLGKVQVLAEVIVNGRNLGILWKPPFRLDVTDAVRPGDNDLEIRVTNLWPNRLIGDEKLPAENEYAAGSGSGGGGRGGAITKLPDWYIQGKPKPPGGRTTFTTWKHWTADAQLLESGLIGPVQLRTAVRIAPDRQ
jgi:hypothetical protein